MNRTNIDEQETVNNSKTPTFTETILKEKVKEKEKEIIPVSEPIVFERTYEPSKKVEIPAKPLLMSTDIYSNIQSTAIKAEMQNIKAPSSFEVASSKPIARDESPMEDIPQVEKSKEDGSDEKYTDLYNGIQIQIIKQSQSHMIEMRQMFDSFMAKLSQQDSKINSLKEENNTLRKMLYPASASLN